MFLNVSFSDTQARNSLGLSQPPAGALFITQSSVPALTPIPAPVSCHLIQSLTMTLPLLYSLSCFDHLAHPTLLIIPMADSIYLFLWSKAFYDFSLAVGWRSHSVDWHLRTSMVCPQCVTAVTRKRRATMTCCTVYSMCGARLYTLPCIIISCNSVILTDKLKARYC